MPMLLSWPINLSFPGWEWGLLFLKKLQFNLGHLPSLRPIQVLSSSHYVWSNPSLLGLQSRTPAPCGWDCSGSAGRRHLCNYTMIHCLLFVPRESFHGLERSAMEAELSTASRHACLYRTSTSFCNHKLPKCAENMNSHSMWDPAKEHAMSNTSEWCGGIHTATQNAASQMRDYAITH